MKITKNILKLAMPVLLSLLPAGSVFAQGVRYDNTLTGVNGIPRAGATVALCQNAGLATTAASVSGNVATLTMAANPVSVGFVPGGNITVSGFAAADSYLNSSWVLTAVTATSLSFNITHSNATASSNGGVTQSVSAAATCAPFASIYLDSALSIPLTQPIKTDGLGNYGFWTAPGAYTVSFNGAGITPATGAITVPCIPNSTCPGVGSGGTVTSFSAGNLSPLFTTSVATQTSTPSLSFTLSNAAADTVFGNCTSSTAAPSFCSLVGAQIPAINLASSGNGGVSGVLPAANHPATTSNCSGVQFAQGLNAGMTPVCATPPTFVASGASHAVGYVPDPGSSAGTTRFLREDATWQTVSGGVSEATWSSAQFSFASAITQAQTVLPNAHTLERFTIFVQLTLGSCSTSPVLAFKDITANSVLASFTVANATPFTDSGSLSVAMTAGDTFGFVTTTAGVGCTGGSNATITAVFK